MATWRGKPFNAAFCQGLQGVRPDTDLMQIPAPPDGNMVEPVISALASILEKFRVVWAQGTYVIVDKAADDTVISDLLLRLEAMRSKNINRVQVLSGRRLVRAKFNMGFNSSPSRVEAITQFMNAYTYVKFPVWKEIDDIVIDHVTSTLGAIPNPWGYNIYFKMMSGGFSLSEEGKVSYGPELPIETIRLHPTAFNMPKNYGYVSVLTRTALKNADGKGNVPSLLSQCISKVYDITMDQTPSHRQKQTENPSFLPGRGMLKKFCYPHVAGGRYPLLRPDYVWHTGSFKTGGEPMGVYENLMKANRETVVTKASPKHVLAALMGIFRKFNIYNSLQNYSGKKEFMDYLARINIPWDTVAGMHFTETGPIADVTVDVPIGNGRSVKVTNHMRYAMDVDRKDRAFPAVVSLIDQTIDKIQSNLRNPYEKTHVPQQTAKIAPKVEIMTPDVLWTKCRIFFIAPEFKVLLHKALLSAFFGNMYGRSFCGPGHCWARGGVWRVSDQLHFMKDDMFYFQGDFKALDQSLKAGILALLGVSFTLGVKLEAHTRDARQWKEVMCRLIAWLADDTAVTLVKWFGEEWRMVVGVMFSGEYVTSMFDTLYVYLAMMVVHYSLLETVISNAPASEHARITSDFYAAVEEFLLIYGDDTDWSLPRSVVNEWSKYLGMDYLDYVIKQLKEQFDMVLKPKGTGETAVFPTPWSPVTPDGVLIEVKKPEGYSYGLKWLKRHFVRGKLRVGGIVAPGIMPMRRVTDVWGKATNTYHDAYEYSNDHWLARIKAFALENMGCSQIIDEFCRLFHSALEAHPVPTRPIIELPPDFPYKGRLKSQDGTPIGFANMDNDLKRKYMLLDPDMSPFFLKDLSIPPRSVITYEFSAYMNAYEFYDKLKTNLSMSDVLRREAGFFDV